MSEESKKKVHDLVGKTSDAGWSYIRNVVDTAREPFLILDEDLHVLAANESFYRVFEVTSKETEGEFVYDLGNGQWAGKQLRKLLEDILPNHSFFKDFEVDHEFPVVGRKIILLNARRIYIGDHDLPKLIILAMEDITKQRMIEEKLKEYSRELEETVKTQTHDLKKRVDELELLNRVMIGREIKMTELKKEIEDLKNLLKSRE